MHHWQAVTTQGLADTTIEVVRRVEHEVARVMSRRRMFSYLTRRCPNDADVDLADLLVNVYQAALDKADCSVLLDSSKSPPYAAFLARSGHFDVHVLHVVRDPRAVAFSWQREKRVGPHTDGIMRQRSAMDVSIRWLRHNITAAALRRVATNYKVVRYEDLVTHPVATLSSVEEMLDLEPSPPDHTEKQGHAFLGNPARFVRPDITTLTVDDPWKEGLSTRDRRLVTALTLPVLRWSGYRIFGAHRGS